MINTAFILGESAFEDIYGQENLRTITLSSRLLGKPCTATQLRTAPPSWLGEVEALFTGWEAPRLDAELLARMPRLRAVFYGAGSIRPIASDALWKRGIVVVSAAALNAQPVVEFTLGAIQLSFKRAWHHARLVRTTRRYEPRRALPMPTGAGAIVGLVSLGLIGRGVARQLRACDVRVLAFDPNVTPAEGAELGCEMVSLAEIFRRSDIVSLHTPLLPETTGFIDAPVLSVLPPDATLINTARGGLIREPDLVALLQERPDVQAILDVTDPEPPRPDSPLYDLPNVFLTPHIAGSLGGECRRMGRAMIEEFYRYVRGEPLRYAVTREQLAHTA
ncbi:MAG TPA: hydroxyacid dehydrogenase [Candidatus Didemnitutus sp.]|nr:hydroxyacid dehydrogenase [Candidatus Didemnitutus sp.]